MVFVMVTSDRDVMILFIFPCNFRLNTDVYIKYLEELVLTWIERVATWTSYVLQ